MGNQPSNEAEASGLVDAQHPVAADLQKESVQPNSFAQAEEAGHQPVATKHVCEGGDSDSKRKRARTQPFTEPVGRPAETIDSPALPPESRSLPEGLLPHSDAPEEGASGAYVGRDATGARWGCSGQGPDTRPVGALDGQDDSDHDPDGSCTEDNLSEGEDASGYGAVPRHSTTAWSGHKSNGNSSSAVDGLTHAGYASKAPPEWMRSDLLDANMSILAKDFSGSKVDGVRALPAM